MGATGFGNACPGAPPTDFHRPSKNFDTPIGIFEGQSDIGSALVPGSASYERHQAIHHQLRRLQRVVHPRRFRYLWKKMSGDVSLAADITFPEPKGYGDRKAVLVIRQDLDDIPKRPSQPCTAPA